MEEDTPKTGSNDDYVLAAIAHGLLFILPAITPLIIWALYKDKSSYVKNQAMQALVYQIVVFSVFLFLWMAGIILSFIIIGIFLLPIAMAQLFFSVLYGFFAAYKCLTKENFKYAVVGGFVDAHM